MRKNKSADNSTNTCLDKNLPMLLYWQNGRKMGMKNYVAYNAYTQRIQITKMHVYAEYQKLISNKENWLCVINVDVEVAQVLIE